MFKKDCELKLYFAELENQNNIFMLDDKKMERRNDLKC